ncbi:MAG: hypothetical protein RLZ71_317 [Actinomycetota bacterium]|jgi:outer membrane protein OmpA-like peptidoglycan-associated protein
MAKKLASLFALFGLIFAGLIGIAQPASAATDDATLSALDLVAEDENSNYIPQESVIAPGFSPEQTYYEAYSGELGVQFYAATTDAGATIMVNGGDVTNQTLASGSRLTIHFPAKANNVVTFVVTAANGTTTKTYTVNTSATVMPQPEIISYAPNSVSTAGGNDIVTKVKHAYASVWYNWGPECRLEAWYSYKYTDNGQTLTDNLGWASFVSPPGADGVSSVVITSRGTQNAFRDETVKANLTMRNFCHVLDPQTSNWRDLDARADVPNALSFYNPKVTSVDTQPQLTAMQMINVHGVGMTAGKPMVGASFQYLLRYDNTGTVKYLTPTYVDENNVNLFFQPWWNDYGSVWNNPGPVTLTILQYDSSERLPSVELFSKKYDWVPEAPTQVSVSPAKGPLSGGNYIYITGHHLCWDWDGFAPPAVKIGDNVVQWYNIQAVQGCNDSAHYQNDGKVFNGLDKIYLQVPAAIAPGAVDMSIDNGFGFSKISTKYVYGTKPTVSSIAPATVSNEGGSTVTITGANFGISGTPTVTIDGIKSPYVQRISSTKLLAMVPASSSVGSVDVNVISSSGGGALDSPATLDFAASTAAPTITSVTPSSAGLAGGEIIKIVGTGFSPTATGVTIGGIPAFISSATATSLEVEVPNGEAVGPADVAVGTPTGLKTKTAALTYTATPGVTSVNPAAIRTVDSGSAAKVAISGIGFGASGTIKVGTQAAVAYTATNNGTRISGIAIPTGTPGAVTVSILPKGAKVPFLTAVQVNKPTVNYVGPTIFDSNYQILNDNLLYVGASLVMAATTQGGTEIMVKGTNFGTTGKIKIGTKLVTPTRYSDSEIVFRSPALTAGKYAVEVVPGSGTVTAKLDNSLLVGELSTVVTISSVQSSQPNTRGADRNTYDPAVDTSDLFTITGKGFASTDAGASTRVLLSSAQSVDTYLSVKPVSITDTSITFKTLKSFPVREWVTVKVQTKTSFASLYAAVYYAGIPPVQTTMSPRVGLCTKSAIGSWNPEVVTASGASAFGASGTVSIDGTVLDSAAVNWSNSEVVVSFANLPTDLANPWGQKEITFTPSDSALVPQTFSFDCRVSGSINTKLNGSTNDLTINAGTSYTAGVEWNVSVPNTTVSEPADGYMFQTAEDYNASARGQNVQSGLPKRAGEYYVWAKASSAVYDTSKYLGIEVTNAVHLTINGLPVSFTPKLATGTGDTIVYRGQLGDGSTGSANDITYTKTTTADPVTAVSWQYRNHTCSVADPNSGWSAGLPNSVAIAPSGCGGDDTSVSSWDIRVASFSMVNSAGVDVSGIYLPTYNTFNLTITKRSVTVASVKAEKVYDGTNAITLGEITVTGGIPSETPTLDPGFASGATFADAIVGQGKPITLSGPLQLSQASSVNYVLTSTTLVATGKITKSSAVIQLTPSLTSVFLGNNTPTIDMTVNIWDSVINAPQIAGSNPADAVLVSATPTVCSITGTVVTALHAGDCVIRATQAASTNYNAAVSYHDPSKTEEEITVKVYGAPKTVQVVADDLFVTVGDSVNPTFTPIGLLDGDYATGVSYEFYDGSTLINGTPTEIGTYRIVPSGGQIVASDPLNYSSTIKYVTGKLVITQAPPVITASSPAHGPEAGGNTLVITGTGLGTVTSIRIGDLSIRKPKFIVNGTGTQISLKMPAGVGGISVTLFAGRASVATEYVYDPAPPVTGPVSIELKLNLKLGVKLAGQSVTVTGGGLKPNSEYLLTMHSNPVVIYQSVTDASGNFNQTLVIPGKACLAEGRHDLTLSGTSPADKKVTSVGYFYLDANCVVAAQAVKASGTKTWTLNGFLFDYLSPNLNAGGLKSLKVLATLIKGAKTVTIYGYTETDTKSAAVKAANIILAKGRCDSVVKYLKSVGIKARYITVAKGGVDPVSLKDQSKNRRVVIEAKY